MNVYTFNCATCGHHTQSNKPMKACIHCGGLEEEAAHYGFTASVEDPSVKVAPVNDQPQVGGDHYRVHGKDLQVWDLWLRWKLNPFQAIIVKHIVRYPHKLGMKDLLKARQYLDKLIEEERKNPLLIQEEQSK